MANMERLTRWVTALESGDFRQTSSFLRLKDGDGVSYCCIGVLSEQAEGAVDVHRVSLTTDEWGDAFCYPDGTPIDDAVVTDWRDDPAEGTGHWGPNALQLYLELDDDEVKKLRGYANLNDLGYTFAQIARKIREDFVLYEEE